MKAENAFGMVLFATTMVLGITFSAFALIEGGGEKHAFTTDFMIERCTFSNTGANPFFNLNPGSQLVLEGEEDKEYVILQVTVLNQTEMVDGVLTRVVEEMETHDGETVEISRNYFAICNETNSVFYFGEDTDVYENGDVVSHEGSWRAGESGAEAGIIMPGTVLPGSRYYQEIAPDVAMDRAENVSLDETVDTPAGVFSGCLKAEETSPIEPNSKEPKFYAPGIGLVQDDTLLLSNYTVVP